MSTAHLILAIVSLYAAAGVLFGGWFITSGLAGLDSTARAAPIGFRVLILPGVIALWPVLGIKLFSKSRTSP